MKLLKKQLNIHYYYCYLLTTTIERRPYTPRTTSDSSYCLAIWQRCFQAAVVLKMAAHGSSQEITDEDAAVLQFPKGKTFSSTNEGVDR